jgi:ATP-dependent helicase/nuclease subunit B
MPPEPLQLADTLLYLPTRRATRALQDAFLRSGRQRALLLPRIRAIADGSEEAELIAGVEQFAAAGAAGVKRVISELERRMVLTVLTLRWGQTEQRAGRRKRSAELAPYAAAGARTPAQAARMARELARLIDALEIEQVDMARLKALVPEDYSEHWSRTLAFLGVVTEFWPQHLAEGNLISPVARRRQLIRAEIERLQSAPPPAPVIVAGVTGADPDSIGLLRAVAALPNGALVLPAVDRTLDEESWASIAQHPEHPQFGLKKVLDTLGLSRADLETLGEPDGGPARRARWSLVCEAMRPAATTDRWHRFAAAADRKVMAAALTDVCCIEAADADEEAEVIALMLREAAETPGRTAMLVAPDRALARRVAARLAVWDLHVDDMGGEPFGRTPTGAFLDLVAAAVERRFEPVALMALLKHPLCRIAMPADARRRGVLALELGALRAPYFGKGLEGAEAALERGRSRSWQHAAVRRLEDDDWRAAREVLRRLRHAFAPLAEAFAATTPARLQVLAAAHVETAHRLARASDDGDDGSLRQGEAGEWASRFFASLIDPGMPAPAMAAGDYPDFYRTLVAEQTVRPRAPSHPRLAICDPFEARLQQPDLVILGALNEGTWPRAVDPGPWLNRPMRQALGLPPPEADIGAAAHDLAALLAAPRVVLTRAAKVDGAPTVPSRWLLRLQALVDGMGLSLAPERPWLAWAQQRSAAGPARPVPAPDPRPPVAARPRKLSVTAIEKWIANPYAIFAGHILGLEPLPALGQSPGPALRGQIIHETLRRFAQRYPADLPGDVPASLMAIAADVLADYTGSPRVAALWVPRLARFAAWFAETEAARRAGVVSTLSEVSGKLVVDAPAGPFTLTARADRIDAGANGLVITDYKSGQNLQSLAARALSGHAPQLPLEAAIAAAAGFAGVGAAPVALLRYISTSGGEPPGQEVPLKTADVAVLAREAQHGLARLIAEFDRQATPYRATRRARFQYQYDEFAHLARVAEWSADAGEED